jgi:nitrate reductase (cytochrome), electron transfer subunit
MKMKLRFVVAALCLLGAAYAADAPLTGLRGPTPLDQEPKAPRMANVENTDVKRGRAYTSQPPTIPHSIEKYEITRNVNFCMYCHSRVRNEEFGAPMVSATHYMDREHDYLAEISPRRYFCTQCHVPQTDAKPPVDNRFEDVYDIVAREQAEAAKGRSGRRE